MKILVIGAAGTIGSEITQALQSRCEVITAGKTSGDVQIDVTDQAQSMPLSIKLAK
ncbi:hypothetical protein JCM19238_3239 [Vibrio ponticus]|nr:hypothetical protein JCM19238_3239 [Vibrio ponticus]